MYAAIHPMTRAYTILLGSQVEQNSCQQTIKPSSMSKEAVPAWESRPKPAPDPGEGIVSQRQFEENMVHRWGKICRHFEQMSH